MNKGKTDDKNSRKRGGGGFFSGPEEEKDKPALRHCPICGSPLSKGEKVKSVLYPGEIDRLMEIYGCPHCYPPRPALPRICPVCHKGLSSSGIIYARFFQRKESRQKERAHVHVLGCSSCYTRSNSTRSSTNRSSSAPRSSSARKS